MKILNTIKKHVEEKVIVKEVICDLCNLDIRHCRDSWDLNEIKIEASIGNVYPECDTRILYITDICAKCFTDSIMPKLKEIGVKFREVDAEDRYRLHE